MRNPLLSAAAFGLFQLLTATLFLRPAEILSWLQGMPIYEGLIIGTFVLSATSLESHFRMRSMLRQPITLCAVGLLFAMILSHLTHMYLGGVKDAADQFLRTLLYYGLLITTVNTPRRLRAFLANVAVCTTIMVGLCLFDYWGWLDLEFIVHLQDLDGHDEEGNPQFFMRMRGTGIFMDPNDLAMVIVAGGVMSLYFLTDKGLGPWRWSWLIPIGLFAAAILETKSRGGLLAAVAAVSMLGVFRFGPRFAAVLAVLALCVLPVVAGRAANIDMSDGSTGQERIEMWREGFEALKSPDLLFGTGHNTFAELAGLVAHNSFVHTYVELGIVGGTLFFGCFYLAGLQLHRIGRLERPIWHPELLRMRPYVAAVLTGWCMSMFSLSRCYVVPTYLVLGLAAAYLNLAWIHTPEGRPLVIWNQRLAGQLTLASAMLFVGLYAFTVVFA
uniref:O-antigen ligase domain-containing protein n=1 Tax=Schlesneria paludicola TaxID=360056 RepID=A0A7C2PAU5_9PLAN